MKNLLCIVFMMILVPAAVEAKEVRYADVLDNPSQYMGKTLTMSGEFAYAEPMRGSFTFDQNGKLIEVLYGDLPEQARDLFISQRLNAKTPVVVTGVLQRYTNSTNKYFITASAIQIEGGFFSPLPEGTSITYSEIVSEPSKYVGKTVTMSGEFAYAEPMRGSFTFDQNGKLIEVLYGELSKKDRDLIVSQQQNAKTPVVVTGVLQSYTNKSGKYFLTASSVSLKNRPLSAK